MSDDRDRDDDRIRPSRGSPMRPGEPASRAVPPRRDDDDDDRPPRRENGGGGAKTLLIVLAIVGVVGFCLIASVVVGIVLLVRSVAKSIGPAIAKAIRQKPTT